MLPTPLVLAGEEWMIAFVFGGGALIAIVVVVLKTVSTLTKNAQRERTRREIAAYVAEGSITSEEGERLMRAATDEAKPS